MKVTAPITLQPFGADRCTIRVADHNYDPGWDYDVDEKVPKRYRKFVTQLIEKWKTELLPKVGLFRFSSGHKIPGAMP